LSGIVNVMVIAHASSTKVVVIESSVSRVWSWLFWVRTHQPKQITRTAVSIGTLILVTQTRCCF